MRIAVGSDHAGFELKEFIKSHLVEGGYDVVDLGPNSDQSVDYTDFARLTAEVLAEGRVERGVLVCGTGIGMAMAANRFKGVRAVVIRDENDAHMSRAHNNANMACLGARVTKPECAAELIDAFLSTDFEGGRHERRINKMDE
jgi:ribose 5-phosphate isomerase B